MTNLNKIITINSQDKIDEIMQKTTSSMAEINRENEYNNYYVSKIDNNPLNLTPISRSLSGQGNDL